MAKVFIFGMAGLILVGLIALAILLIAGAIKISSLMFWRKGKTVDPHHKNHPGGSRDRWLNP